MRACRRAASMLATLKRIDQAIATAFDIRFAFSRYTLGEAFCRETLGLDDETLADPKLDILSRLGFSRSDVAAANIHACGTMSVEGARDLKREHLSVFDCANPSWTRWHTLLVCRESHTHDGCSTTLRIGRHLQDHQHAQRSDGRGLPQGL